jgi:hypothetical protein
MTTSNTASDPSFLEKLLFSVALPILVSVVTSLTVSCLSTRRERRKAARKNRILRFLAACPPNQVVGIEPMLKSIHELKNNREELELLLNEMVGDGLVRYDNFTKGYSIPCDTGATYG